MIEDVLVDMNSLSFGNCVEGEHRRGLVVEKVGRAIVFML